MSKYRQQENIVDLLTKFFSGELTPEEKGWLYRCVADDKHKDEIIVWLQQNWEISLHIPKEAPGEEMFAKIKEEIRCSQGKKDHISTINTKRLSKSTGSRKRLNTFFRYAAVFILAFGISWILHKSPDSRGYLANMTTETIPYNEIVVPYGSKTMIVLSDSTKVWLNAGARFKYPTHFDNILREVYLQGEAFFDVTKDAEHPFFVKTNGIDIKVLGTKFNLKANADDDYIEAALMEGAIEILGIKTQQQDNLLLEPGQKLTLYKEKENIEISNVETNGLLIAKPVSKQVKIERAVAGSINIEQTTAWTENKLVFVRERFEDVETKLERWYGVDINVINPEILDYRFTGTFEKQTFEQAMNALSKAASCRFRIDKNQVIVF